MIIRYHKCVPFTPLTSLTPGICSSLICLSPLRSIYSTFLKSDRLTMEAWRRNSWAANAVVVVDDGGRCVVAGVPVGSFTCCCCCCTVDGDGDRRVVPTFENNNAVKARGMDLLSAVYIAASSRRSFLVDARNTRLYNDSTSCCIPDRRDMLVVGGEER
jgi:hypothetical protein